MFGIGFGEVLIVLLAAIIFVNPKDLPGFFRKAGKLWADFRSLQTRIKDGVKEVEKEIMKEDQTDDRHD